MYKYRHKKRKRPIKNLLKKGTLLVLSVLMVFSSTMASYSIEVQAKENSLTDALLGAINDNSYEIGSIIGSAIGSFIAPGGGTISGASVGGAVGGTLLNAVTDYFVGSDTTDMITGSGGSTINYIRNSGVSNSTTNKYSVYNENRTYNSTTNNYDYTYNWYNPITNNYDITNEYYYNSTYNTYNYEINNNNYVTNYYIQDNSTHVTYYIIETNTDTDEVVKTLIDIYYQLPDGRNSYYLTAEDIHGIYFTSNYSQYVSVAEDDGTTLGLWHLDGDLKDSSYWNNTIGKAYSTNYVDSTYTGGYKFGNTDNDYLQLNLDNVDLPETWTLEWVEYVPNNATISVGKVSSPLLINKAVSSPISGYTSFTTEGTTSDYKYYYYDEYYYLKSDIVLENYLGISGGNLFEPVAGSYIPYAITYDGENYCFYVNGQLTGISYVGNLRATFSIYLNGSNHDTFEFFNVSAYPNGSGIDVTSDYIKFYSKSTLIENNVSDSDRLVYFGQYSSDGLFYNSYSFYTRTKCKVFVSSHKNSVIDEVRLSSGVLYNEDYTPNSQPFETNNVLVVPTDPSKHEIAFRTNYEISDVRIGGVRPTYPTNGYIYISLDDDMCVEDIQQYQSNGWYSIEASIYSYEDIWETLKGFDMDYLTVINSGDNADDSGPGNGGGSNGGSDNGSSDSSSSGGLGAVLDAVTGIFDMLLKVVASIVNAITSFVDSVLKTLNSLTGFTNGFSSFLSASFGFLPEEAIALITSGIGLLIMLAVIKFLK